MSVVDDARVGNGLKEGVSGTLTWAPVGLRLLRSVWNGYEIDGSLENIDILMQHLDALSQAGVVVTCVVESEGAARWILAREKGRKPDGCTPGGACRNCSLYMEGYRKKSFVVFKGVLLDGIVTGVAELGTKTLGAMSRYLCPTFEGHHESVCYTGMKSQVGERNVEGQCYCCVGKGICGDCLDHVSVKQVQYRWRVCPDVGQGAMDVSRQMRIDWPEWQWWVRVDVDTQ